MNFLGVWAGVYVCACVCLCVCEREREREREREQKRHRLTDRQACASEFSGCVFLCV